MRALSLFFAAVTIAAGLARAQDEETVPGCGGFVRATTPGRGSVCQIGFFQYIIIVIIVIICVSLCSNCYNYRAEKHTDCYQKKKKKKKKRFLGCGAMAFHIWYCFHHPTHCAVPLRRPIFRG
jgi:hypothetical protein